MIQLESQVYRIKRNNYCLTDSIKKKFNNGMHSDTHELIRFKLGLMEGTTELYIFSPV